MKKFKWLFVFIFYFFNGTLLVLSQDGTQKVVGFITAATKPLANVEVTVDNTDVFVVSDSQGKYEIAVAPKQTLVFSYLGMDSVEIIIEDATKVLNVTMSPSLEILEEVVVSKDRGSKRRKMEERYSFDKNIVHSAFGYINAKTSGHRVLTFDETDFEKSAAIDIADFLEYNTSARVLSDGFGTKVILRNLANLGLSDQNHVAFDIDGAVTRDLPLHIPIGDVKRIAVIYGPSLSLRYGNIALGGVIIINTISAAYKGDPDNKDQPYDYAKLRGNKFRGQSVPLPKNDFSKVYLSNITKAKTKEEALKNFNVEKDNFKHLPFYLLDVADYFKTFWGDKNIKVDIYKDIEEIHGDNANVLKVLAYNYQIEDQTEKALLLYEKIVRLRPDYAQSYRDLANIYIEKSFFSKAAALYARYESHIREENTHSQTEIDSIIRTESKNFVLLHGEKIAKGMSSKVYKDIWPVRLVLDWSHTDAEFEVQLIHPEGYYTSYENTLVENPELMKKQKMIGYSSKQFYIDDLENGNWKVNLKYLGNKSFEPTYLKATIYYNYNDDRLQQQKIQLFKLSEINRNFSLLELSNSTSMRSEYK